MMEVYCYTKYEDLPGNKDLFIYGFKNIKSDKIDNYILIGCDWREKFEIDKIFHFSSDQIINEEIENKIFKLTGWFFMNLVKRNIFLISRAYFGSRIQKPNQIF